MPVGRRRFAVGLLKSTFIDIPNQPGVGSVSGACRMGGRVCWHHFYLCEGSEFGDAYFKTAYFLCTPSQDYVILRVVHCGHFRATETDMRTKRDDGDK